MTNHDRSSSRARLARRALANLALAAVAMLMLLAGAGPAGAQPADGDPPSRVARLSEASGQVWLYGPDSTEWLGVARNQPLTTGDRIATDTNARAEIALGSTTLRLDAGTELEVVRLDDSRFVVRLVNGSVVARVRNPAAAAELEIESDEGRFRAQSSGRLRVDRFDQASDLTVYAGQAVFEGRNSALPLSAGQHGQFWLDASGAAEYTMVAPVRDAFTAWNDERDRAEDSVVAARYVSPEMTGAGDLDRYGRWEQTPEYGAIWTPAAVPDNWAPYSTGHWAFVRPWGWTWVDDAPWGFAPFHYGRWVNYRDRWCWAPGTYVARPVYAPALVAWVGGPRVSVSINIGGGRGGPPVGWFPLAPREVYVPSYRSSPGYVRNVNITHVTNITNITTIVNNRNGEADRRDFANRRFPNAVTVVPSSVLTGRQAVGPSALQYRNNPQVRAFVADARPGAAMSAAPVTAPPAPQRGPDVRPTPKPPFEGRGAGGYAGRDGGRPNGDRPIGDRPGGDRSGGDRQGGAAAPVAGASPQGGPPPIANGSPPRPGGAAAAIAPQRPLGGDAAAPIAPQRPMAGEAAAPIAPVAPMVGRPPRGAVGREPVGSNDGGAAQRVIPPSPVQRGVAEQSDRPAFTPREGRPPKDMPSPGRGNVETPRAEPTITRVPQEQPRPAEAVRPAPPARPMEQQRAMPPALQQRMNEMPRAETPRPAPAVRAPEARAGTAEPVARQEPPRGRDESRRDEPKRDDNKR